MLRGMQMTLMDGWVQTYEKNPLQIFVDVKMITAEDLANPSCKALLTELLERYKFLFGGKLTVLAVSKMQAVYCKYVGSGIPPLYIWNNPAPLYRSEGECGQGVKGRCNPPPYEG